jgi:hypothetical protein
MVDHPKPYLIKNTATTKTNNKTKNKPIMNQYFYLGANNQQNGPVPAESLKAYGVTKDTLVWCDGMANWAKASDVPELAPLFAPPTPPVPPAPPTPPTPPAPGSTQSGNHPGGQPNLNNMVCPDNYLVWSILATIFCCWPLGIPAIVNATKVDRQFVKDVLKVEWRADRATQNGELEAVYAPNNTTFVGEYKFVQYLNEEIYAVESPDAIVPVGENAYTVMRYSQNNNSAAAA